jgi:hypothetical protein
MSGPTNVTKELHRLGHEKPPHRQILLGLNSQDIMRQLEINSFHVPMFRRRLTVTVIM